MTKKAQKTSWIEAGVIRLEVEAKALKKEAYDRDSLQERLKYFEDGDTFPVCLKKKTELLKRSNLLIHLDIPLHQMLCTCQHQLQI